MATITELVEKRSYNLLGDLDDEEDALTGFFDYSGGTYICDAISEISDNNIPTYNGDVWENASNISEYIEEAIEEGIAPTQNGDVDLVRIFQSGYYVYYQRSLYDNLDTLAFNYVADRVNEAITNLGTDTRNTLDISEIEDAIESEIENCDNNNRFDDLDDTANDIIERIKGEEFKA